MSGDTPVNTGVALSMPLSAEQRVLGIQARLHQWAAADPGRRFDDLHNLVADPSFLVTAWMRVRENKGARTAGIDKRTARSVEQSAGGVRAFLEDLRGQLKTREFRPLPVRQRTIPKANGKVRSLGIPTVADRAVQASLKLVLEPIFEAGFSPCSYGFRPERRCQDAIEDIRTFAYKGYELVFEGDIASCFDEISHTALMSRVRDRIGDKRVLALVKAFLKAGVVEETGTERHPVAGTPQGGILSPLLANIALSVLDEHFDREWARHGGEWNRRRHRQRGGATYHLVRYADDFVIMVNGTRDHAQALWGVIEGILAEVGLCLAPEKTRLVHLDEGFDFLGFRIQRHRQWGSERRHVYSYPSRKSQTAIRRKVKAVTAYQMTGMHARALFIRIGQVTRGWVNYFRHGASKTAFLGLENYVWHRTWTWLRNKHPQRNAEWIARHYYYPRRPHGGLGFPRIDSIKLFKPGSVPIQRYRYRGKNIPAPWTQPEAASASK
jgi:RNA-directed DNA polymerase